MSPGFAREKKEFGSVALTQTCVTRRELDFSGSVKKQILLSPGLYSKSDRHERAIPTLSICEQTPVLFFISFPFAAFCLNGDG